MFGLFILINLLLVDQILTCADRKTRGVVSSGYYSGDSRDLSKSGAGDAMVDFASVPGSFRTKESQVRDILDTRGVHKKNKRALLLLAQAIDKQAAHADQVAKDRRCESYCNCVATATNTLIAITGLGLAVWSATSKQKQD